MNPRQASRDHHKRKAAPSGRGLAVAQEAGSMTVTLEALRANRRARALLQGFDFEVQDHATAPLWFDATPLAPFEIVAARCSGCVYALVGPQRHVLLATSAGQAAIVAANLGDCLELIVAHPYWQDILCRSHGGLDAMRRLLRDKIADFEAEAHDDDPDLADHRAQLRELLGLRPPRDPMQRLHHAVTTLGAGLHVRAIRDGDPLRPMVRAMA
jgi:hypothetical protein